jgi:hypothetical protein
MPRRYVIGLVAASAFFAAALVAFMRGTPDAFPFGDAAVIQIYTLERAAVDVVDYIERHSLHRPLFHISQETWLEAACVVLHAYKHHPRLAVDQQWITVFGDALSPSGREDAEFYIVGHREHATLSARHDDRLISSHNGLFVHVFVKRFQPTD